MQQENNFTEIRDAICKKYSLVSISASGKFKYPTGREGAELLGYDANLILKAGDGFLEPFCGVGDPFSPGNVNPGELILDVGCGAGFDLFVASHLVGKSGKVYGIDLSPQMLERARENLSQGWVLNVELKSGNSEKLPFASGKFDLVISNGVLNLSPDKKESVKEIFRVLKAPGRFQFADMVLKKELPPEMTRNPQAWSQ
ncbi:methyltransferase domain-containing protein [Candidatus Riflebacteria bacterium]